MALSSRFLVLAIIALCSVFLCLSQVNASDSHDIDLVARHEAIRGHDAIAKRSRSVKKRSSSSCPAKTSSSSSHTTTSTHKTTTTPKPVATAKSTSQGNRKVGLGYSGAVPGSLHFWKKPSVGGLYTWSPWCPPEAKEVGIPCYPMLWGYKSYAQWDELVKPGYSTIAIGPNEVNLASQSNLSPGAAAAMWRQKMIPLLNHGYRLISPSTTNAPSGLTWMQNWFRECPDCRRSCSAVNVHFYGTSAANLIAHLKQFHDAFGLPIWVTEFACEDFSGRNQQCSAEEVKNFMDEATHFMDTTEWVQMYFWFGMNPHPSGGVNPRNAIMNSNGSPNTLGLNYLNPN